MANKKGKVFGKDVIPSMVYAFGGERNPPPATVHLLEDLAQQYISDMTKRALSLTTRNKITVEHILFLVRKDPMKHSRVKELLKMNERLKRARKNFEDDKFS